MTTMTERIPLTGVSDFAEFVTAASPRLLRTAWLLTGDTYAAEDLVQEALARVYPKWSRVRGEHPLAYTRKVVVNLANDRWKRTNREQTRANSLDRPTADQSAQVGDRDLLMRLLATLPPRERQVVVLRHYDDLSEREVADLLGISVGTVKSTAHKALLTLRTRYAALEVTE